MGVLSWIICNDHRALYSICKKAASFDKAAAAVLAEYRAKGGN